MSSCYSSYTRLKTTIVTSGKDFFPTLLDFSQPRVFFFPLVMKFMKFSLIISIPELWWRLARMFLKSLHIVFIMYIMYIFEFQFYQESGRRRTTMWICYLKIVIYFIYLFTHLIMSGTFIKIDSLQHLEISRQTYPTNRSKIRATAFTVLTLC